MKPPEKVRIVKRRLWWVRPRNILIVICLALAGYIWMDWTWVRANGIVSGELTAESPIVQARLERLSVKCLDHVTRGQRLAEFRNDAMAQLADQQLQQLQFQLEQARAEIAIADREAQAAAKLADAQRALLDQQAAVLQAEDKLREEKVVAELVWQQAKAAVDRADAEWRASQYVYETKRADQQMAQVSVEVLEKRIDSFKNSPELTGHFFLTAAKDGVVTECTAREGEIIAARTAILSIFSPSDIYAVVFFDPGFNGKLSRGQKFDVSVQGVGNVAATLTDFYPELSALPSSLTRFFWQKEMWSQYLPVRLDFVDLAPLQRDRISAWAQVSASLQQDWKLTDIAHLPITWWLGVQAYLGWTAEKLAQVEELAGVSLNRWATR
jgi:multidrug resistance efflux pump